MLWVICSPKLIYFFRGAFVLQYSSALCSSLFSLSCSIMFCQCDTTPLHMAAFSNNARLITVHLKMGADVNSVNRVRKYYICSLWYFARALCCMISMMMNSYHAIRYDMTHQSGATSLHTAAFEGHEQAASLLLDRGANPNAVNSVSVSHDIARHDVLWGISR